MNRRDFFIKACTLGGCAAIAGMLLYQDQQAPPASLTPSSPGGNDLDLPERRQIFQKIEGAGFHPRDAMFWEKTPAGLIKCTLCPTFCTLKPYERGRCRVRFSLENRLVTVVYGKPCSAAIDPIEKKPVFHLIPGSTAFSIATAGCLLGCRYCQNWQISQKNPEELDSIDMPPEKVVAAALENGCKSIAYTYTEPTIFFEYMYDTAILAKKHSLRNVVVSCGYINPEPLATLVPYLDVMKVDLKGFTERFYQSVCGGSLEPVLTTLKNLSRKKILIDIVTLVVPTLNDDPATMKEMFTWLFTALGPDISLFLSRFHPTFQLKNLPPTPIPLMESLRQDALNAGLRYVYLGNVPGSDGENTCCPQCHKIVVGRQGYQITEMHLKSGACEYCGHAIPGIWE